MHAARIVAALTSLLFAGAALTGCGASLQVVNLNTDQRVIAPSDTTFAQLHLVAFVEPLQDARPSPDAWVVGRAHTGVINRGVPIHAQAPVSELCTNQMRSAWMTAGVNLAETAATADVIVRGRINQYWVGELGSGTGAEASTARVELDVAVYGTHPEARLWYGIKAGRSRSERVFWDTSEANGVVLNQAVTGALRNLLTDDNLANALLEYARACGKVRAERP